MAVWLPKEENKGSSRNLDSENWKSMKFPALGHYLLSTWTYQIQLGIQLVTVLFRVTFLFQFLSGYPSLCVRAHTLNELLYINHFPISNLFGSNDSSIGHMIMKFSRKEDWNEHWLQLYKKIKILCVAIYIIRNTDTTITILCLKFINDISVLTKGYWPY